jgi:hypothetical protein
MAENETKDVKVTLTLTVPATTPDTRVQRTIDTLGLYAAGMGYVQAVKIDVPKRKHVAVQDEPAGATPAAAKE